MMRVVGEKKFEPENPTTVRILPRFGPSWYTAPTGGTGSRRSALDTTA